MTKKYYECHVTMLQGTTLPGMLRHLVEEAGWKFSSIADDINLGEGVKLYATRQFNIRTSDPIVVKHVHDMADVLENHGAVILRRKVETVIYDDRSSLVKPCDGGCIDCHVDDAVEHQNHVTTQAFKHIISAMARAGLGIAEVDGDLVIKIARTDMLEARREELVNKVMEGISDIMLDASVDFPAGREAGHRIEYDEDAIRKLIDHAI